MINKIQCWCYSCHHLSNKTRYQLFYYPNLTITVNWRSLGCGQNKTFEDVTFKTWGHFIDQKNNCLTKKQQRQWLLVAAQLSTLCTAQFNDSVWSFFSLCINWWVLFPFWGADQIISIREFTVQNNANGQKRKLWFWGNAVTCAQLTQIENVKTWTSDVDRKRLR